MAMMDKPITIIGCGPGALEYLSAAAVESAMCARVLIGAAHLLTLFPQSKAKKIAIGAHVKPALAEIERQLQGGSVGVLVTGDPGVCSLARPVLRRFGREQCKVIPAVSSVQLACARLGLDWWDARIISAHGGLPEVDGAELERERKLIILAGGNAAIKWIAETAQRFLFARRRCFVCEDLSLAGERVGEVPLESLSTLHVSSRTIVVIVREDAL